MADIALCSVFQTLSSQFIGQFLKPEIALCRFLPRVMNGVFSGIRCTSTLIRGSLTVNYERVQGPDLVFYAMVGAPGEDASELNLLSAGRINACRWIADTKGGPDMNCLVPGEKKCEESGVSKVNIIGAYNTAFGAFVEKNRETREVTDKKSFYELLIEAGRGALADANMSADEIDGVWVGACSPSMFVNQEHVAPLAAEIDPDGLRWKPMTRVEGACASSSVALYNALYAIESGRFNKVLVLGVEKMNLLPTKGVTHALACCSYWPSEGSKGMTFPGLFGELAKSYKAHYKLEDEPFRRMLAEVSALCYRNGLQNPLAHFGPGSLIEKRQLTTAEAILALPDEGKGSNPMIAPPLRLHDCSLISDGAAAVALSSKQATPAGSKAVEMAGIGFSVERSALEVRQHAYELQAAKDARGKAFAEAGITIANVDLAEVHDCFTINQLLCTEALGLSQDGRAGYDYSEGRFSAEDRCPVNLSGGLKAKGHPVGATGVSMHALTYKQLIGEPIGVAPTRQPEVGVVLNVGGSAVTNCVSVLRRC